jgi:hypothetical protein
VIFCISAVVSATSVLANDSSDPSDKGTCKCSDALEGDQPCIAAGGYICKSDKIEVVVACVKMEEQESGKPVCKPKKLEESIECGNATDRDACMKLFKVVPVGTDCALVGDQCQITRTQKRVACVLAEDYHGVDGTVVERNPCSSCDLSSCASNTCTTSTISANDGCKAQDSKEHRCSVVTQEVDPRPHPEWIDKLKLEAILELP